MVFFQIFAKKDKHPFPDSYHKHRPHPRGRKAHQYFCQYYGAFYYAVDTFGDYKIPVASKTGTAQIGEGKTNNGIFVCFAPYDDPEVAIAIMVEHGKSGATIAFMAREALDAYFSIKETSENIESEMTLLQ